VRAVTRFKTPFKVPLREDPQTKRIGAVGVRNKPSRRVQSLTMLNYSVQSDKRASSRCRSA
jgi:hypothetical protein